MPTADGPVEHRWRKIIGRTLGKAWGDSLFGLSAQAAFWCALSTAPFLLALLGLSGFLASWLFGPDTMTAIRNQATTFLNTVFNAEVANDLLGNTIDMILRAGGHGFSGGQHGATAVPVLRLQHWTHLRRARHPDHVLLFCYFISMAIIIGAQFNNALLGYYPPVVKKPGRRSNSPAAG